MSNFLSLAFLLLIGLLANMTSLINKDTKVKISGIWEFNKVVFNGKVINVSDLNECEYNDKLEIQRSNKEVNYKFEDVEIRGFGFGISNVKSCILNPIDLEYSVADNSCETEWISTIDNPNIIVSISDGLVIEYEMNRHTRKEIHLVKVREILNYGSPQPDKIILIKVKSR